jgi:hypothetical protein
MKTLISSWPKFRSKRISLISPGLLQGVSVLVTLAVTLVPMSAGVVVAETPATGLVFMSPEEYQLKWGRSATTAALVTDVSQLNEPVSAVKPPRQQQPQDWSVIMWDESDLRGVSTPVRVGNNELGYRHYSIPHNLKSRAPIHAAFQTHKPDKEIGAHLEYVTLVVDPDLQIRLTIRVVVQAATRTDDGRYITTDGKYVGVITAFCEEIDPCPAWVNNIKGQ